MIIYLVNQNTKNISTDVINTILLYNKEDLTKFVEDIYKYKEDILFLYEEDYQKLEKLDPNDEEYDKKMDKIFENGFQFYPLDFLTKLYSLEKQNPNAAYIIELLNPKKLFIHIFSRDNIDKSYLQLCFKILEDKTIFNRYLDFNKNLELF